MEHPPITLNVLGYQEKDEWVALALEMDLRGYGETFDEAFEDLSDLVSIQISFSRFKGQPELIWKAADRPAAQLLFLDCPPVIVS